MTHDPLPEVPAHALSWLGGLTDLLPQTLTMTLEVSSGWLIVLLIGVYLWRDRQRR